MNDDVLPTPGTSTASRTLVTAIPTVAAPIDAKVSVWSAASSITQTFRLFAQEPGFFAAKVKSVASA